LGYITAAESIGVSSTTFHRFRDIAFDRSKRVPTIFWYKNSRTFKDPEVAFSRTNSKRKFTAWTILQQYLISVSVITGQF